MKIDYTSAAVLPTALYNREKYFYFAKEKSGMLSTFGGKRDANEKISQCAARELSEESLGVFCSKKRAQNLLKDQTKNNVLQVKNRKLQCITYIVPLNLKKNPMEEFKKRRSQAQSACQKEVLEIVAMKASTVIKKLQREDPIFKASFRGCVYNTLQKALKANKL